MEVGCLDDHWFISAFCFCCCFRMVVDSIVREQGERVSGRWWLESLDSGKKHIMLGERKKIYIYDQTDWDKSSLASFHSSLATLGLCSPVGWSMYTIRLANRHSFVPFFLSLFFFFYQLFSLNRVGWNPGRAVSIHRFLLLCELQSL